MVFDALPDSAWLLRKDWLQGNLSSETNDSTIHNDFDGADQNKEVDRIFDPMGSWINGDENAMNDTKNSKKMSKK